MAGFETTRLSHIKNEGLMIMALILTTGNAENPVWIKGTDEVFSESLFAGENFSVKIIPLTRSAKDAITRKHTTIKKGVQITDWDRVSRDVFMKHVVDWKGVAVCEDSKVVELVCNRENKLKIVEESYAFADAVAAAIINRQKAEVENKEEEEKN